MKTILAFLCLAVFTVNAKGTPRSQIVTMDGAQINWHEDWLEQDKPADKDEWWKKVVVYQIYPRSFKDSEKDDGIGDLQGIIDKIGYLKDLGIGAVWLSPIYTSPNQDYGYDVQNHTEINPEYGNMTVFENLVKALHKDGIKLIMDFVPNHTSKKHNWFVESEKKNKDYMDYYIWMDGKGVNGTEAPNCWTDITENNPAWTYSETRKQWYYHIFSEFQPDLNYTNQKVKDEMNNVLKFWQEKGVDGFRVDAVPYLIENFTEPVHCDDLSDRKDLNETYDIVKMFSSTLNSGNNTSFMVVEATTTDDNVLRYYVDNNTMPFNFKLMSLDRDSNATEFIDRISTWVKNASDHWTNWFTGNHDSPRVTSRFDPSLIDALNMLTLMLPGTAFTYYGEEIGMNNVPCKSDSEPACKDARSIARTPFQWDDTNFAGFSKVKPWLNVSSDYWSVNVAKEKSKNEPTHLSFYKDAVKLRKEMLSTANLTFYQMANYTFGFSRGVVDKSYYLTIINLDDFSVNVKLNDSLNTKAFSDMYVRVASINSKQHASEKIKTTDDIELRPMTGLVVSNVKGGGGGSGAMGVLPKFSMEALLLLIFAVHKLIFTA